MKNLENRELNNQKRRLNERGGREQRNPSTEVVTPYAYTMNTGTGQMSLAKNEKGEYLVVNAEAKRPHDTYAVKRTAFQRLA